MKNIIVRPVLVVLVIFIALTFAVRAQVSDLLTNPGFEQPFPTVSGTPPRQVAQGWTPWHISGGASASENIQPEYYPASDVTNGLGVPRIRNGNDAQQYHTFYATHDGGLYQRVTGIASGTQLRFSAYVYVWSSSYDDVNVSELPGGVVVQVGIDPTGGTSGASPTIIWSQPTIEYDAYNEYSVTATASGTAVTVFVRTVVTEPVKSTNIYVDDASLTAVGVPTATPTNTSLPPTATNTVVPPTHTPPVVLTAPVPATATPVPTFTPVLPTFTPIPTITPTQEIIIPTATPITPVPTATIPTDSAFPGTVIHTVRAGDTVGQLAALYGSSVDAIIQANGLGQSAFIQVNQVLAIPVRVPNPVTPTPSPAPIVSIPVEPLPGTTVVNGNIVYMVQPGDTLFRIALRFSTTVSTLARLNGIVNPNLIFAGQALFVPVTVYPQPIPPTPSPATYVVQYGDTLFRVALRFRVSIVALIQANGILDPNRIYVGQVLLIP
ncbi:MAG: LysM peptidoglycan-binding domain-containing protein [Chloroflexi bacterium]|nr:LysM peptidoglycan-binding domain-containing protein [Chloroflexota bacterium]